MNVGAIIVEQLDWDGCLKTLVFTPQNDPEFWVALTDEYREPAAGPFHLLDPQHEREFGEQLRRQRPRLASRFHGSTEGEVEFATSWRDVPTLRGGGTVYALCLPEEAVPTDVQFTNPRPPNNLYRHREILDRERHCVVCYLSCRSRHGKFDFDVRAEFKRDPEGLREFSNSGERDWPRQLEDLEDTVSSLSATPPTVINQFFEGSRSIHASDGSAVIGTATGPVATAGAVAVSGDVGGVSTFGATSIGTSDGTSGATFVRRAAASAWTRTWVVAAGLAAVAATVLLATGVTNVGVASIVLALVGIVVGVVPLMRG